MVDSMSLRGAPILSGRRGNPGGEERHTQPRLLRLYGLAMTSIQKEGLMPLLDTLSDKPQAKLIKYSRSQLKAFSAASCLFCSRLPLKWCCWLYVLAWWANPI